MLLLWHHKTPPILAQVTLLTVVLAQAQALARRTLMLTTQVSLEAQQVQGRLQQRPQRLTARSSSVTLGSCIKRRSEARCAWIIWRP